VIAKRRAEICLCVAFLALVVVGFLLALRHVATVASR
jgi:hypothetical protein